MKHFRRLWDDDAGFVVSAELVLVATIVVIGMVVGLVFVRNQVVQELVDVAQAIGNMNQSYAFGGIYALGKAVVGGAAYVDVADFCQQTTEQVPFAPAGGIVIPTNGTDYATFIYFVNGEKGTVVNDP